MHGAKERGILRRAAAETASVSSNGAEKSTMNTQRQSGSRTRDPWSLHAIAGQSREREPGEFSKGRARVLLMALRAESGQIVQCWAKAEHHPLNLHLIVVICLVSSAISSLTGAEMRMSFLTEQVVDRHAASSRTTLKGAHAIRGQR